MGIGDRILVFCGCLALAVTLMIAPQTVVATLLALTILSLSIYFENKIFLMLIYLMYIAMSYRYLTFVAFYPVILYEILNQLPLIFIGKKMDTTPAAGQTDNMYDQEENEESINSVIVVILILAIMAGLAVHAFLSFSQIQLVLFLILVCMTVKMNHYCQRYDSLRSKYIKMRDDGAELNLALKNKNQYLIEKQDSEIHVATLKERNRIAREIHDNVGHMLSRSILQTGALLAVNKNEELNPFIQSLKDTLDTAMNNIRTSVHDLYDESIDLKMAIQEILKEMTQYQIDFEYDVIGEIPRNVKYCMISIVKEATSNIIKHSDADKINVVIREHPAFYQLMIHDNGTSNKKLTNEHAALEQGDGIGLSNMQSRVETLNGAFHISTEQGFKIFISIPK